MKMVSSAQDELFAALDIKDTLNVCFVCTGNTCRSPMAAALFNYLASGMPMRATSAGLYAQTGDPIADNAVKVLKKAGVSETSDNRYTHHTARNITAEIFADSDRVICMTANHALHLIGSFPQYTKKISTFRHDLLDPYGGNVEVYKKCLDEIKREILSEFPSLSQDRKENDTADD